MLFSWYSVLTCIEGDTGVAANRGLPDRPYPSAPQRERKGL